MNVGDRVKLRMRMGVTFSSPPDFAWIVTNVYNSDIDGTPMVTLEHEAPDHAVTDLKQSDVELAD